MKTPRDRLLAGLAALLLRVAAWLLPSRQAPWARAMRAEVLAIGDPGEALAYAWGCFTASLQAWGHGQAAATARPDRLGLLCASAAVLGGSAFMATQAAPNGYAWINALSLTLAWASFALLPRHRLQHDPAWRAWTAFALGGLLLASALGAAPTGWLPLGPVAVQPAWLLGPALWVVSSRLPSTTGSDPVQHAAPRLTGLWMGQLALMLQAQAGLLLVTTLVLCLRACRGRSWAGAGGALLSLALAAAAVPRWTVPPPLPFVDEVLQQAFAQRPGCGLVLATVWLSLLLPGLAHHRAREHGLAWLALLALSLPGWLPTPVLGFGGSFILGYVLSLAVLPGRALGGPPRAPPAHSGTARRGAPPLARASLA